LSASGPASFASRVGGVTRGIGRVGVTVDIVHVGKVSAVVPKGVAGATGGKAGLRGMLMSLANRRR
ncbi:hypothetical protein KIPB_009073, partial [Kipferlia bialata]